MCPLHLLEHTVIYTLLAIVWCASILTTPVIIVLACRHLITIPE